MRKVSDYTTRITQGHALKALKHGEAVIRCGKALQEQDDQLAKHCGQSIEEDSLIVQLYTDKSLLFGQVLQAQDATPQRCMDRL